jgi:glutamate dehydrogenase (NAD(P)+)
MMTVYSGPVFDMAVNQFGVIANHLEIRWTSATES